MSDRIFYTLYRFFEGMHGPGDAAEVAAVFTWSMLLFFNSATVVVLLLVAFGNPPFLRAYIPYALGAAGMFIAATQCIRYWRKDGFKSLYKAFGAEPARCRSRRLWMSFAYTGLSLVMFIASLWLLSANK